MQHRSLVALTDGLIDSYVRSYSKPQTFHHAFEYYRALPRSIAQNEKLATTKVTMPVLAVGGGAMADSEPGSLRIFDDTLLMLKHTFCLNVATGSQRSVRQR